METVKIEALSKNFGGLEVLKDLSTTIETGEYVAIIGPNGAGKSTLINLLSGELRATSGRMYLSGKDITNMPPYRRTHLGLSRSFQINRLFYDLSVLDNVLLALQGTRPSRYQMFRPSHGYGELMAEAQRLLGEINLWGKRGNLVRELAYGEQREMEIVLSLAAKPGVLLLDEPSAGLAIADIPNFIDIIRNLIKGTTLIFAAHDMDVVFGLADRVLVLYFGKFIADGKPEEIKVNPQVKEIYLGIEEERFDA
jgi:branched-chain amino acid transport system ATP-binding protein